MSQPITVAVVAAVVVAVVVVVVVAAKSDPKNENGAQKSARPIFPAKFLEIEKKWDKTLVS